MNHPSLDAGALMLAGIGLIVLGGWQLTLARRSVAARQTAGSRLSLPTHLSIAVVLIALGYHLIVWGISSTWGVSTPVAVPRDRWFVAVGFGAAWIVLSVWLDRLEHRDRV